jgi:dihydroxy-acid dehydratase
MGPVAVGMPEVLLATAALSNPELHGKVALVSDARISGVSHGAIGIHCSPEAAVSELLNGNGPAEPVTWNMEK